MNPAFNKQGVYAVQCSATYIVVEGVADCEDPRAVLAGIERNVVGAGRWLSVPPNKAAKRFVSTGQHTWALHEFAFGRDADEIAVRADHRQSAFDGALQGRFV